MLPPLFNFVTRTYLFIALALYLEGQPHIGTPKMGLRELVCLIDVLRKGDQPWVSKAARTQTLGLKTQENSFNSLSQGLYQMAIPFFGG